MKVSQLLEDDAKMTRYYTKLVEKTKSFVPSFSDLNDSLGDGDIYGVPSASTFYFTIPINISFKKMDIADLYTGSRKKKRELSARTAKFREVNPEFIDFKKQVNKMVRVWQFYGLSEITRTQGPAVVTYRASVDNFNVDEALALNDKFELLGNLKFKFHDDGSLNG